MRRLFFEKRQRRLAAFRLKTHIAESLADGSAEFTDALFVVDDQQADAKIFFHAGTAHCVFPIVFEMTSINCCTRKGFSTHGAPVCRSVATVSSLAISPVMNTTRSARSGRWRAIQA